MADWVAMRPYRGRLNVRFRLESELAGPLLGGEARIPAIEISRLVGRGMFMVTSDAEQLGRAESGSRFDVCSELDEAGSDSGDVSVSLDNPRFARKMLLLS